MVGKNQIQIAGNQFAQGLATSDFLGDGGIGMLSQNINPLVNPGSLYATGLVSKSGVTNSLVATSEDYENQSQTNRWLIDSNAGTPYYVDSSNTIHTTSTGGTGTYTLGISDAIPFKYNPDGAMGLFMTSTNDIDVIRSTLGSLTAKPNYWTAASGLNQSALTTGVPHPLIVFEQSLWVGDGNKLHSITAGAVVDAVSLTLPLGEEIMCLGIDPVTGLMMIGVRNVSTSSPPSTDVPAKNYIYLFDGFSSKARRKIPVWGTPFSFTGVAGDVFVGMDNAIGQWNGNGVTFKRRLGATSIPHKHRVCTVGNFLIVADGLNLLAFGDIQNEKRVWFPLFKNNATSDSINVVWQQSRGVIGFSYASSTVKFIDLFDTALGAGSGIFYTNNINFERPVDIRRIRVFTTGITTTAGIGGVSIIDENQITTSPTVSTFVVASGTRYVFDFDFNYKLQIMQPKVTIDTQVFGITKVIIYYDVVE